MNPARRWGLCVELFEAGQIGLGVGGELRDLVAQHVQRDFGTDRERGLVDPLSGQRGNRPGTDEDPPVAVGEQAERATRLGLVCPGAADGLRKVDLDAGRVMALVVGLAGGQAKPVATMTWSAVMTSPSASTRSRPSDERPARRPVAFTTVAPSCSHPVTWPESSR
jgi:hypothetical protein